MKNGTAIALLLIIFLPACMQDTLDRKPLNRISDSDVWVSEQMIDIYLAKLYDVIPIGFATKPYLANLTDESSNSDEIQYPSLNAFGKHPLTLNTSMYSWIRQANYFIERIKSAGIPESSIKRYLAECRFIRAYYYFDLVRKYGGMPIVEEVQTFTGNNLEALLVPRNKEAEVYDFILAELNAAILDLPESRDVNSSNRVTKSVAQAFKSRTMLYAGSIAKYGTVKLNGLVGIQNSSAEKYFTEALSAAESVMKSGRYGLYDKLYNPATRSGDPVANYQQIFTDKGNKEVVFQKEYRFPDKVHNWDIFNIPFGSGGNGNICPTLEMVESYEFRDGTPGTLQVDGREFDSPEDLYKNKDPRFHASVYRSGSPYKNETVEIHRGIYDVDGTLYETEKVPFPKDPSVMSVGKNGPYPSVIYTKTGFYVRKITVPSDIIANNRSDQNYIDIRYAEVLLNYAEAALELGNHLEQALDAINQIRGRAGIRLISASELTVDRLRNERKVELAFEDKRFWDIRRWRIGTTLFKNTFMHGLYPYLKYNGSGYRYIFKKVSGHPIDMGISRVFEERDYYSTLSNYISTNSKIANNPGW